MNTLPSPCPRAMRGPIPSVFPPNPSSPHEHPTLVVAHHYENRPYLSVDAHIGINSVGAGFKPALAPNPSHCPRACGDPSPPSFPRRSHPSEHAAKNLPPPLVSHHYENRPYLSVHAHIAISLVGAGFKPALAPNPSHCPRACGDPSPPFSRPTPPLPMNTPPSL